MKTKSGKKRKVWVGYARYCRSKQTPKDALGIVEINKTDKYFNYYGVYPCCTVKKVKITIEEL